MDITGRNEMNISADIGLASAEVFVDRKYISEFSVANIKELPLEMKDTSKCRLIHIATLVYAVGENIHDKLVSVFSTLTDKTCSLAMIIDAHPQKVDLYLGIYAEKNVAILENMLYRSVSGNFDGSRVEELTSKETRQVLNKINKISNNVAALTLVPSVRNSEDNGEYIQGLEKFMNSMIGKKYMAVILATTVDSTIIQERKNGLEELYSMLSVQRKLTVSYGANQSEAVTDSVSKNITDSVNRGISKATSRGTSKGRTTSISTSMGGSYTIDEFGIHVGRVKGTTESYGITNTLTDTVSEAIVRSDSSGVSKGITSTRGYTNNITREVENKGIQNLMNRIDEQINRMEESKVVGIWECSGYFISEDNQTALIAANTYRGLMIGEGSGLGDTHLFNYRSEDVETNKILDYIRYFQHPEMLTTPISWKCHEIVSAKVVSLSSLVTGFELPVLFHLPEQSLPGIEVLRMADFARNIITQEQVDFDDKKIHMGNVYSKGRTMTYNPVKLGVESLTSHCFITGTTGSGKTNSVYRLMEETLKGSEGKVKFLVLEPVKGEYKNHFGKIKDMMVYTTNPEYYHLLKINPFSFPEGIHVLEHLDRLIEVFSACWPLYAAMPAVLKKAFELAYIRKGWDLNNSIYLHSGKKDYPNFLLLMECLKEVINTSEYSKDSKSDYIGALCTRVESLTNGIYGKIFTNSRQAIDSKRLFDENVIIDLSRIGSSESKALIMGLLVMQLKEYRVSESKGANLKLRHITIMEEAHNLLKRVDGKSNQDGSNIQQQSVEMLSNLIAELRSYGEGFVIVDQSPATVDDSAIRNTNTKIIMRLPDAEDCNVSGKSVGITEEQIAEISKLEKGVAIVRQSDWREAVLCKVEHASEEYYEEDQVISFEQLRCVRGKLCENMMYQYLNGLYNINPFREILKRMSFNRYKKQEMYEMSLIYVQELKLCFEESERKKIVAEYMYDVLVCEKMFEIYPMPMLSEPCRSLSEFDEIPKEDCEIAREWKNKLIKSIDIYGEIESEVTKLQILQMVLIHREVLTKSTNLLQIIYLLGKSKI